MSERVGVLIVGAGPSGLMLACQLARHDVSFRIIDKKEGPTLQSRALGVQARSVEVYDQLSLAPKVLSEGILLDGAQIYAHGRLAATANLADFGKSISPYAGLHVLEQSKNEAMLVEKLREMGHEVDWGFKFASIETADSHCNVTVNRMESYTTVEVIRSEYVVACDGASSPVRHALNLPFEGGTYAQTFYVADIDIDGDLLSRQYLSMFMVREGFGLAFPMKSERRFRLIGAVPSEAHEKPGWLENPDFQVVAEAFKNITKLPLELGQPEWFATYSVHHRKIEKFREGRVLFVGDAAHVHSPAGGQGMNTGLLDAHNLGWKLAYVVRGLAGDILLDSYNTEREAFARQLLRTTDSAFTAMSGANPLSGFFRMNIMPFIAPLLLSIPFVRTQAFYAISQTAISYRSSVLSCMHGQQGAIKAGDRVPPFHFMVDGKELFSFDLLKKPGFVAMDFSIASEGKRIFDKVSESTGVNVHYHYCEADEKKLSAAGLKKLLYLIRPDMYVGLTAESVDDRQVLDYFKAISG